MDDVKTIAELAKQLMLKDGYHAPMVFIKGTNGNVAVEMKSFGDTNYERVRNMLRVGMFTASKSNVGELELIVLVSEAWISKNFDMLPSQDPKHTELLLINSLDARTQEENIIGFEIIRDQKGQVVDFKDWSTPDKGSVKGTLLPAFQKGYQIFSPVLN